MADGMSLRLGGNASGSQRAIREVRSGLKGLKQGLKEAVAVGTAFEIGQRAAGKAIDLTRDALRAIPDAAFAAIDATTTYGDEIGKTSARLNVGAEALQGWTFAAERSGSSGERLRDGLKDLARNINEAARNAVGPAADAFEGLGVSFLDSEGRARSTEEVFRDLADSVSETGATTQTTRDLMILLGESGFELQNTLASGADGLDDYTDRLRELGGIMDDEAIIAAEAYSDALLDLEKRAEGVQRAFGEALIPTMLGGATALETASTKVRRLLERLAPKGTDAGPNALRRALGGLANVVAPGSPLATGLAAYNDLTDTGEAIVDEAIRTQRELREQMRAEADARADQNARARASAQARRDAERAARQEALAARELERALEAEARAREATINAARSIGLTEEQRILQRQKADVDALTASYELNGLTLEQFGQRLAVVNSEATEALGRLREEQGQTSDATQRLSQETTNYGQVVTDAFGAADQLYGMIAERTGAAEDSNAQLIRGVLRLGAQIISTVASTTAAAVTSSTTTAASQTAANTAIAASGAAAGGAQATATFGVSAATGVSAFLSALAAIGGAVGSFVAGIGDSGMPPDLLKRAGLRSHTMLAVRRDEMVLDRHGTREFTEMLGEFRQERQQRRASAGAGVVRIYSPNMLDGYEIGRFVDTHLIDSYERGMYWQDRAA